MFHCIKHCYPVKHKTQPNISKNMLLQKFGYAFMHFDVTTRLVNQRPRNCVYTARSTLQQKWSGQLLQDSAMSVIARSGGLYIQKVALGNSQVYMSPERRREIQLCANSNALQIPLPYSYFKHNTRICTRVRLLQDLAGTWQGVCFCTCRSVAQRTSTAVTRRL